MSIEPPETPTPATELESTGAEMALETSPQAPREAGAATAPLGAEVAAPPDAGVAAPPEAELASPPDADAVVPAAQTPAGDAPYQDAVASDWDDEDEFGWAVGSELEFVDDDFDEWDGPVGDGLDEEEGLGGMAIRDSDLEKPDTSTPSPPAEAPEKS